MGARTGAQYIERLGQAHPTVHIHGETLHGGIAEHPAFRNLVATYAGLYDMQSDPALRDVMTYESPSSGERVGTSFLVPASEADLVRRRTMMKQWADRSLGTLGRTGDYLNCALAALSEAGPWFAQADAAFAANVRDYYQRVREEDLLLTHTLIPPQANRSQDAAQQQGGTLTARIVREDDNGVVISGARMLATIGPIADEMLVFPSTVLKGTPEDAPYSFALAVSCDTPGLRFICRESLDYGRSRFDHPLGSRFEEIDAVVVFDEVHVPYERCFMLGHPELCNTIYTDTGAIAHMTHQVATRTTAKTEAVLGLISLLAETIGIDGFQHVQEDIAEVIVALEIVRALVRAAEADAAPNDFGVMTPRIEPLNACRNWFPRISQRFPQIIRKLGASGLMALPTEADIAGEAHDDIERYLQSATLAGPERVRLFRLAWDMSMSAFAGRQALYEYYFFGDPVRMAGALIRGYDRAPYMEAVQRFLDDAEAGASEAAVEGQGMTRIGVIGAGIAGLHVGLALRAHDVDVTIYTDRGAEEVAAGPLLNTVAHHHHTLERERALGVCHWEAEGYGYGCHHHCVVGAGPDPVRFRGDFEHPSVVIDHRLYLPRLMGDFEERGGELVVGAVAADALGRLAREYDLLVIATGRAGLATLFGRRDEKSPYEVPQRRLSAGIYHGVAYPQPTGVGVHMSLGHGELLELPITSREGRATVLLFENIPGGGLDELVDRPYADDARAYERLVLEVLETHYPACLERVDGASFALQAPRDILQGALTPIVREDWAIIEERRIALAAGDAHTVVDPVNGQGANSASHSAWVIAQAIAEDYGLDERFARRVARDREAVVLGVSDWTNMTLNPPPQMVELLFAMASSKPLCDAFSRNFNHPDRQADALATPERTAAFIARWSEAA